MFVADQEKLIKSESFVQIATMLDAAARLHIGEPDSSAPPTDWHLIFMMRTFAAVLLSRALLSGPASRPADAEAAIQRTLTDSEKWHGVSKQTAVSLQTQLLAGLGEVYRTQMRVREANDVRARIAALGRGLDAQDGRKRKASCLTVPCALFSRL